MAKQKKKRTKVYRGSGATATRPTITKVSAANRSAVGQWWFEKKRVLKPVLITATVIVIVVWLIIELIRVINGG